MKLSLSIRNLSVLGLLVAGLFSAPSAGAQMPKPFVANPEALKDFADENVGRRAIMAGDLNQDGFLSKEEAEALTVLNLGSYRIDPFDVTTYEDLAKFPNLKEVYLGESDVAEVDLSRNPKLETIGIQSDALKVLIISVSCQPRILYPPHSGEVTVRRAVNADDPSAIWYY